MILIGKQMVIIGLLEILIRSECFQRDRILVSEPSGVLEIDQTLLHKQVHSALSPHLRGESTGDLIVHKFFVANTLRTRFWLSITRLLRRWWTQGRSGLSDFSFSSLITSPWYSAFVAGSACESMRDASGGAGRLSPELELVARPEGPYPPPV